MGRNCNPCALLVGMKMVQLLWKTVLWFLRKLKIELPYDLAILLLGIYPKELKVGSWRAICSSFFIAALFTIAKKWKQPKYSSADEWINKMCYVHTVEYYSAFNKGGNSDICYNIDELWWHYANWNKPITKRWIL